MGFSGYTNNTPEKLLLDAGVYFKNFLPLTDTYESAKKDGKLIGATQGGGSFSAVPTVRKIEIDGVKGAAKGLETIDEWNVTMVSNVKEVSADTIAMALTTAIAEVAEGYTKITSRTEITQDAYIENITWIGRLSGSLLPVIIVLKNALCNSGLSLTAADKSESVIALTMTGHFDPDNLDEVPFEIYYPGESLSTLVVSSMPSAEQEGYTKISVSPTLVSGNTYLYEIGSGLILPKFNQDVSGMCNWDGAEIEAANGGWIMVVEADAGGKAKKGGITQIRAND